MVGGQPPGSVVTNLSGVGMLREGRDPEVNGRTGSAAMSSPRARLSAAAVGRAAIGLTTAVAVGTDAATLIAATSTGAASAGIGVSSRAGVSQTPDGRFQER